MHLHAHASPRHRPPVRRLLVAVLTTGLLAATGGAAPAAGPAAVPARAPYGGPEESQQPGTRYHGPDRRPRWLTTACRREDGSNCYWDAGRSGNGRGRSFWAVPVGPDRVAVVYWSRTYNKRHGYVTER